MPALTLLAALGASSGDTRPDHCDICGGPLNTDVAEKLNEVCVTSKQEQAMNDSKQDGHLAGLPKWRPIMNRDDVPVWFSFVCFVALCGAAIWVLSRPACDVFG